MPIRQAVLPLARTLIAQAHMTNFVAQCAAPNSIGGEIVPIALIDRSTHLCGVQDPKLNRPDSLRPGVIRSDKDPVRPTSWHAAGANPLIAQAACRFNTPTLMPHTLGRGDRALPPFLRGADASPLAEIQNAQRPLSGMTPSRTRRSRTLPRHCAARCTGFCR